MAATDRRRLIATAVLLVATAIYACSAPTPAPVSTPILVATVETDSPTATATVAMPTLTPTAAPTLTPTAAPTLTPRPSATPTPTALPTATAVVGVLLRDMNVRACPSTDCRVIAGMASGSRMTGDYEIVGVLADLSWMKLRCGGWMLAGSVQFPPAAPIVVAPPLPTPALTRTATPTATPTTEG